MPFEKKTVYHSQLVSEGPISVLITSDPIKSKYKRDGEDQFFVGLKIDGKEHQYIIENDAIHKKMFGFKGHVVTLTASGSREEADMEIASAAGPASSKAGAARSQQAAPPADAPPPAGAHETVVAVKTLLLRAVCARVLCHEAALAWEDMLTERDPEQQVDEEDIRCIGSSLFIMLDRRGMIDGMPWKLEPKKKAEPAPAPKPPPKPAPPPRQPEPDDDEIPF